MTSTAGRKTKFVQDEKSNLFLYDFVALGVIPEFFIRFGIRRMLRQKLADLACPDPAIQQERTINFAESLKGFPIALATDTANNQHYEVPTEFFRLILGAHMKYSCCLWDKASDLDKAEEHMLQLYCDRADLGDGQKILDLGCGWGSFSLFAAARYPHAAITAVSNSSTQRLFIESKAAQLGLKNIKVITADINDLEMYESFDRVVSIEMFEHAKNYQRLFAKITPWLHADGKMFVHIFSHLIHQYHFGESSDDWLARYFFTGGTMPSDGLFYLFQDDVVCTNHWRVNGGQYQKTAEAWLQNMQKNKKALMQIIETTYGADQKARWWTYWRLFFLSCAELWGYNSGNDWIVSHYLFEKR